MNHPLSTYSPTQEANALLVKLATEALMEVMARAVTMHGTECYGSLQLEKSGNAVGIRKSPAYPGDRTGGVGNPGEVHDFKAQCIVPHTLDGGQQHDIYFYELADGRG